MLQQMFEVMSTCFHAAMQCLRHWSTVSSIVVAETHYIRCSSLTLLTWLYGTGRTCRHKRRQKSIYWGDRSLYLLCFKHLNNTVEILAFDRAETSDLARSHGDVGDICGGVPISDFFVFRTGSDTWI